jgi:hypothetical protein
MSKSTQSRRDVNRQAAADYRVRIRKKVDVYDALVKHLANGDVEAIASLLEAVKNDPIPVSKCRPRSKIVKATAVKRLKEIPISVKKEIPIDINESSNRYELDRKLDIFPEIDYQSLGWEIKWMNFLDTDNLMVV